MGLNMGYLFRTIMLIWSCKQGDPLDFSLLILPVISLYVGGFKTNMSFQTSIFENSKVHISSKMEIQVFAFFITCQSYFKERMVCLFIKTYSSLCLFMPL